MESAVKLSPEPVILPGRRVYSCAHCRIHTADHDDIVSKAFQGQHGRAFLFNHVVNVKLGTKEDRVLITGLHTVRDVLCVGCETTIGWRYEQAYEASQKYKEGKYIVEKVQLFKARPQRIDCKPEGKW